MCNDTTVKEIRQGHFLSPKPQVVAALLGIKSVIVQVKPFLISHPSGAAENVKNLS